MDVWLIIIWCVVFLGWFIYKKLMKNAKFFDQHGIPYEKPVPFFGNSWRLLMQKENMIETLMNAYNKFKHDL
jgi:hypothetical protein